MAVRAPRLLCLVLLHCVATSVARIPNIKLLSQRQGSNPDVPLNNRPLIGILSQPGDGYNHETNLSSNDADDATSYIAASYVKFVGVRGRSRRAAPLQRAGGVSQKEILRCQWDSDSWRWIQLGRHPLLPCFGEAV